jgi:hypothetical protein
VSIEDNHNNIINCYQCVHFYVTWEPRFPRACRLFGFKSATQPSVAVYETTGEACLAFEKKDAFEDNNK